MIGDEFLDLTKNSKLKRNQHSRWAYLFVNSLDFGFGIDCFDAGFVAVFVAFDWLSQILNNDTLIEL